MSRSGNRLTPSSGWAARTSPGRPAGTGPGALTSARWWPRARPRARSGSPDATGRWGVARLVAQRDAERRAAEEPAGAGDAAPGDAVPDARESEDRAAVPDRGRDAVPDEQGADGPEATADAPTGGSGDTASPSGDDPATVDPATVETTDGEAASAAAAGPEDVPPPRGPRPPRPTVPPSPRPPLRTPLVPRPPLPVPRRPPGVQSGPVVPNASDGRASRPRVEPDPALFGFARHTRGRLGGRLFTLFFVLVFGLIVVQTIASIV